MATFDCPQDLYRTSLPIARYIDVIELDDANAQSWTVPADIRYVLISTDNPIYIRVGGTAAVPTADIVDGTGSGRIGSTGQFIVEEGQAVSMIREDATATFVSIFCYS